MPPPLTEPGVVKPPSLPELPGFQAVDHPGIRVLAREEAVPWVRYVLEGGQSLHVAAGSHRDAFVLDGREPVYVIPAKLSGEQAVTAGGRWAVRRFARGGRILPRLLGDRYLRVGSYRPMHEAQVSEGARARGIPTPRVIAAAVLLGRLFYQGELVTELVPQATDLVESIFDTRRKGAAGAAERLDALKASGTLVRTMAQAGLRHRDLHAGNVLLQWEGIAPRALILDLDLATLLPDGTHAPRLPMLSRLRRSLRKWEGRTGLRLSEREWTTLDEAVMG